MEKFLEQHTKELEKQNRALEEQNTALQQTNEYLKTIANLLFEEREERKIEKIGAGLTIQSHFFLRRLIARLGEAIVYKVLCIGNIKNDSNGFIKLRSISISDKSPFKFDDDAFASNKYNDLHHIKENKDLNDEVLYAKRSSEKRILLNKKGGHINYFSEERVNNIFNLGINESIRFELYMETLQEYNDYNDPISLFLEYSPSLDPYQIIKIPFGGYLKCEIEERTP
ncbi:hypothetical protein [Bartonella sp. DGB2]|uniref:hypothetical protein n=1 Tax=Bartonella sp. DGB2 TaxID=3388426 RepID=UPI00398FA040